MGVYGEGGREERVRGRLGEREMEGGEMEGEGARLDFPFIGIADHIDKHSQYFFIFLF